MAMKRIEAFIASEKTPYVLSALETLGLQATFYESKGMGKGENETLRSARGTGTIKRPCSSRRAIVIARRCSKARESAVPEKRGA